MITTLDKMQYIADYHEKHGRWPDNVSVMQSIQDEQDQLIEKLIDDDMRDPLHIADLLANGFEGYNSLSNAELWEEMNTRGLTL